MNFKDVLNDMGMYAASHEGDFVTLWNGWIKQGAKPAQGQVMTLMAVCRELAVMDKDLIKNVIRAETEVFAGV